MNHKIYIVFLFLLAFPFRLYGLNWDLGYHLHPDERMIVMTAEKINFPKFNPTATFEEKIGILLSPNSSLNPKFFAYGSLPIYLLKFTSQAFSYLRPGLATYQEINLLGRFYSALFDSFIVILIFKISLLIFNSTSLAVVAGCFYALSVLPIQLSHFYAVDTLLTFFIIFTLYQLLLFYRNAKTRHAILAGVGFGLSLATKISATLLIFSIGATLLVDVFLLMKKKFFNHTSLNLKHHLRLFIINFSLIGFFTVITFLIFQPFTLLDFPTFWRQINEQRTMTRNAFIFPYTLQYVNTAPYSYHLKNIFLWGLGPVLGLFAFGGFIFTLFNLIKGFFTPGKEETEALELIIFSFFITYFLVTGNFAVKFMRYCLPLYPIFAIFAANLLVRIFSKTKRIIISLFILHSFCLFAFMSVYRQPHTRITASAWINRNIPPSSLILREHWDDGLPLFSNSSYNFQDLPLYDSDQDPQKWPKINNLLKQADYLVIASNRLYTPLSKLTDCRSLPPGKCYQRTAQYYQDLFSGRLEYKLVAEFTSYPQLFGLTINDQSADESFTVYDHPKVQVYQNTNKQ